MFVVLLKNSEILFGSKYKREIYISQAADNNSFLVRWNERVVIMQSYAEFIVEPIICNAYSGVKLTQIFATCI